MPAQLRAARLLALSRGIALAACSAIALAGEVPQRPQDRIQPQVLPPSASGGARTTAASDRCYTPAANCILDDPQPVGSACWCVTPFGPSFGKVR